MKVQYFGDEHDFRKYVLLRLLAKRFTIGVCWMLTPDDDRNDGSKRAYLGEDRASKWRHYDEELFDLLASRVSQLKLKERGLERPTKEDLRKIESEGLIGSRQEDNKRTIYFEEEAPQSREGRAIFREKCCRALSAADLIFYDPDNGIEVKRCPKGRKNSIKYVYWDELAEDYNAGKSVITYQHFPRRPHDEVINGKRLDILNFLPGATTWAFEARDVVFLLAAQPQHVQSVKSIEGDFGKLIEKRLYKALHKPN